MPLSTETKLRAAEARLALVAALVERWHHDEEHLDSEAWYIRKIAEALR